jgi:hypothetical protein
VGSPTLVCSTLEAHLRYPVTRQGTERELGHTTFLDGNYRVLPDVVRHGNAVKARLFRGPSCVREGAPESLWTYQPKLLSRSPSFIKQCPHFLQGPCPWPCRVVGSWRIPDEPPDTALRASGRAAAEPNPGNAADQQP